MRKVALVGTTSTGADAPYDDETFEIWGVSARADYVTRANRWFELHRLAGEPKEWADGWRKTVKTFSHDVELLMFYPEMDLGPVVALYPAERITRRFGTYFMTSTFAWMMALAIDEMCPADGKWEPGEIAVYGVEMEYDTEYRQQRTGFRHFIDLARVMGITITLHVASGLAFEPVPYPMWQDDPLINKLELRNKNSREKLAKLDASIRNTRTLIAQNNFAIQVLKELPASDSSAARIAELEDEVPALMEVSSGISKEILQNQGMAEEQGWLMDYLAP